MFVAAWRRLAGLFGPPDPDPDTASRSYVAPLAPRRYAEAFQLPSRRGKRKTLRGFTQYMDRPDVRALGAIVGGRLIGYIAFEVRDDHLRVSMLYVAKNHRRRGVGKSLVRAVSGCQAMYGGREVRFAVPDDKVGVHQMLKRCGLVARCARGYFRDGGDAYVFTPPAAELVARP